MKCQNGKNKKSIAVRNILMPLLDVLNVIWGFCLFIFGDSEVILLKDVF